jgi:hypothetical protein
MIITFIPQDKIILKDKVSEYITDENFLSNYADIRCYQINTNGNSWKEDNNRVTENISETEINIISNKFDSEKQKRETLEQEQLEAYNNSWERVRAERNNLLEDTDIYMVLDYPITEAKRTEFQTYRTLLRNIPTTYSEIQPRNITFESGNVLVNETIVITKPSLA